MWGGKMAATVSLALQKPISESSVPSSVSPLLFPFFFGFSKRGGGIERKTKGKEKSIGSLHSGFLTARSHCAALFSSLPTHSTSKPLPHLTGRIYDLRKNVDMLARHQGKRMTPLSEWYPPPACETNCDSSGSESEGATGSCTHKKERRQQNATVKPFRNNHQLWRISATKWVFLHHALLRWILLDMQQKAKA